MLTNEQRDELDAVTRKRHGNAALARRPRRRASIPAIPRSQP